MDRRAGQRVIDLFERRGEVEAIRAGDEVAARACVARARQQLNAAELLFDAGLWEPSFTAARPRRTSTRGRLVTVS